MRPPWAACTRPLALGSATMRPGSSTVASASATGATIVRTPMRRCAALGTFTLPSGRLLPAAPLELIAVLKLIAFADRQPAQTKDADDLLTALRAASHGVYGDETWNDEPALAATGYDHELAAAYRLGRRGIACFSPDRAQRVLDVAIETTTALRLAWRGSHDELLNAWLAGLRTGGSRDSIG